MVRDINRNIVPIVRDYATYILLTVFLIVDILGTSRTGKPRLKLDIRDQLRNCRCPYKVLHGPTVSPRVQAVVLGTLGVLRCTSCLSCRPLATRICYLPSERRETLLR